jgi:hypothetical protein
MISPTNMVRTGFIKSRNSCQQLTMRRPPSAERPCWDNVAQMSAPELDAQVRAAQALLVRARQHPKFDDPLHPSAYEFSQLGRHTGQGKDDMWIGKAAMLGSNWHAVLYLP